MNEKLTLEEQACNYQTMRHIERVRNLINVFIKELLNRQENHDQSKMQAPEVQMFTTYTSKLAGLTFGSPEYDQCKKEMGEALAHHYAKNTHHPEHYKNGVDDMDLVDIIEMFCDWKAASERHNDGNLRKSVEINGKRFNMSTQLVRIFENTINMVEV